jgi:succinyl-CoA synthetase beta subunit
VTGELCAWLAGLSRPGRPDEHEVKQLLAQRGIAAPRGVRLESGADLPDLDLTPPLVVKVCSPDHLHKTETRGVTLDVASGDLADALADIRARFPGQPLLVEEQIAFQQPECIAGALVDPDFGTAVMVGAGGIAAEIYADVGFRLAPCSAAEARHMIDELRIAPLLAGARGARADVDALADVIARLGDLACDLGDALAQLDINPIAFADGQWLALDAALVLHSAGL